MLVPSMPLAAARTSSRLRQNLTPPALPRPPAWIWALTIHCEPPRCLAASTAASGELATLPGGTAMPYCANSSLAWYSWKFIRYLERTGETVKTACRCTGTGEESGRRYYNALPACSALPPCFRMTKTAQYGQVFSRNLGSMAKGCCAATGEDPCPRRPLGNKIPTDSVTSLPRPGG